MPGPKDYAYIVPKLRMARAQLLTPDKIRDMTSTIQFKEVVGYLRDTLFEKVADADNPDQAYRMLYTVYYSFLEGVARASPDEAKAIVDAFRRDDELRDVLAIAQAVQEGLQPSIVEMPTYHVEDSIVRRLARDQESLTSPLRLLEALEGTWAREPVEAAFQLQQETGQPWIITWYHLPYSLRLFSEAMAGVPSIWRGLLEQVICPLVEYRVASAVLQAKAAGLEARLLDRLLSGVRLCGLDVQAIRQAYEREPSVADLAVVLRDQFPSIRLEGKRLGEILKTARRSSRVAVRRAASHVFSSYPFQPAVVAAGVMLVRDDVDNVKSVVFSLKMKLKPDEYAHTIVVE